MATFIKGIFFEWSGVVVDEIEACGKAHLEVVERFGAGSVSFNKWLEEIPKGWEYFYRKSGVPEMQLPKAFDYYKAVLPRYSKLIKLSPDAEKVLSELKRKSFVVGIITTQPKRAVEISIEKFALKPYIDFIVFADDVKCQKPNSESLLKALSLTHLKCKEVIYVEDTIEGILIGKKVGALTARIKSSLASTEMEEADYNLDSLSDILELDVIKNSAIITAYNSWWSLKLSGKIHRFEVLNVAKGISFAQDLLSKGVVKKNCSFADIGCGLAEYSWRIAKKSDSSYVGIDIAPVVIDTLKEKQKDNHDCKAEFINGDIRNIPLQAASQDMVICSHILEHVSPAATQKSVFELFRILKPKGVLVIEVPNCLKDTFFLFRPLQKRLGQMLFRQNGHLQEFSKEKLIALLEKNGFKVLSIEYSGFLFYCVILYLERFCQPLVSVTNKLLQRESFLFELVTKFLAFLFAAENRILRKVKAGLNIRAIAKRQFIED
jgi:HAD superfamily hydrolase (TIGR01509 family)